MGSPSMNLIPVRIEASGHAVEIVMATSDGKIRLKAPASAEGLKRHIGKEVVFGIRPEALTDPEGADRSGKQLEEAECMIEVVEPAGSDTFAVVQLGGREVTARLRADATIESGKSAKLAFNLDKAVFFDPETEIRIA